MFQVRKVESEHYVSSEGCCILICFKIGMLNLSIMFQVQDVESEHYASSAGW